MNNLLLACRSLLRTPQFAFVAVFVVAVGIAATTSIFSVVQATLLRPLPFAEPGQLFRLYESHTSERRAEGWIGLSVVTYEIWRQQHDLFAATGASVNASVTLTGRDVPRRYNAGLITADFFPMLGVEPIHGRNFIPAEDAANEPVVVLGDQLWREAYGASPAVLGQSVVIDGRPCTVIGVMPRGLRFQGNADLWLPMGGLARPGSTWQGSFLWVGARLRADVTPAQAESRLSELAAATPTVNGSGIRVWHARLVSLRDEIAGPVRNGVLVLSGAAAALLLIAGANLAALLLARSLARSHESALRLALGASRWQLARQLIAPGLVLALAGGLLGLLLASTFLDPLVSASPLRGGFGFTAQNYEVGSEVVLDRVVLSAGLGGALLLGLAFGALTAWQATRQLGTATLRDVSRSSTVSGATRFWLRLLVAGEIAVTVVLLLGAVWLARVFREKLAEPWGFAPDGAVAFSVDFPATRYTEHASRRQFADEILRRLRALPGVSSAGLTTTSPMLASLNQAMYSAEGIEPPVGQNFRLTYHALASPGYFEAMRIPLLAGREFAEIDTPDSTLVVIVSQQLAAKLWPGENPLGNRLKRGRPDSTRPWLTVVGVVGDTKSELDSNRPTDVGKWYLPFAQHHRFLSDRMTFVVRSDLAPASLEPTIRAAFLGVDPGMAVYGFEPLDFQARRLHASERFNTLVVSLFGIAALVLAAGGLYGLLSFHVAQRTRELGIRAALGADSIEIFRLVLREGALLWALGLASGVVLVAAASRFVPVNVDAPALFDPATLLLVASILALAAFAACLFPARRATKVDPLIALRTE